MKIKWEFILVIILTPILAYVGWQAYTTWFSQPEDDISKLEEQIPEIEDTAKKIPKPVKEPVLPTTEKPEVKLPEREAPVIPERKPLILQPQNEETPAPSEIKGTLDYAGYTDRDPLRPSLPVKEEKPAEITPTEKLITEEGPREQQKEIVLPTFTVQATVWGNAPPRAVIDNEVHKVGDVVKGATILGISERTIRMIYEGKEFTVSQ
jgi:hypothetical protein